MTEPENDRRYDRMNSAQSGPEHKQRSVETPNSFDQVSVYGGAHFANVQLQIRGADTYFVVEVSAEAARSLARLLIEEAERCDKREAEEARIKAAVTRKRKPRAKPTP